MHGEGTWRECCSRHLRRAGGVARPRPDEREGAVYGVPGGHWESGESLAEVARREIREEAGIEVGPLRLVSVYDFYRADKGKSYVTIGFRADYKSGELRDESAETRKAWRWYDPERLPEPLFPADKVLIERCLSGEPWKE